MVMERYELHRVKVYELNIREAIQDHDLCPGVTSLHAGCFGRGLPVCGKSRWAILTGCPVRLSRWDTTPLSSAST
jgi:hypothetical protein